MKPFITHKSYRLVVILLACACLQFLLFLNPQNALNFSAVENAIIGEPQKPFSSINQSEIQVKSSLEISEKFAIVGVPNEHLIVKGRSLLEHAGAAYIYEIDNNGEWTKKQKIVASDGEEKDLFGWTTTISGNCAIVSAPKEDHDAQGKLKTNASGSVYIFQRDSTGKWIETQKIVASDRAEQDQFGSAIAISGNYLIVGAHKKVNFLSAGINDHNTGAAYIFEKDKYGYWKEAQKLIADEHNPVNGFGYLVSIFDNYAIIGTSNKNNNSQQQEFSATDSAFIYERNDKGEWHLKQSITDPKLTFQCLNKLY